MKPRQRQAAILEYLQKQGKCSGFWKDYINAVVELNRCKYFSGGIYFKIHLK